MIYLFIFYLINIALSKSSIIEPIITNLDQNIVSKDWDFLVFSQQWPPTACMIWEESGENHKCANPKDVDLWTVHGVWPSTLKNDGPFFCNNSWHFDESVLQPILDDLRFYWPNLYKDTPEDSLWAHEWKKHGTCAATLPALNGEINYFNHGIKLAQQYNIYNVLAKQGILPSKEKQFTVNDLQQAVLKETGVLPYLSCDLDKDKALYIVEIRFCFNKDIQVENCTSKHNMQKFTSAEKCPENANINYVPLPTAIKSTTTNSNNFNLHRFYNYINFLIRLTL